MPRKGGGDDDNDDPLRRRQKKQQEEAPAAVAKESVTEAVGVDTSAKPEQETAAAGKKKPDRLDYSRFANIGADDKEERMAAGNIGWDDLNKDEKGQCYKQADQYEEILEKKRAEEDDWRRQLKEKPSDLSWVEGRHFATYEAFCVGRVESTFKKTGNEAFKAGEYDKAKMDWDAGVQMLLALGTPPAEAWAMICVLRNNLAQLAVKTGDWPLVKQLTDKVLDRETHNQKALYRRAQAFYSFSLWDKAEKDLELLLKHHPTNKDAEALHKTVRQKLGKDRKNLGGKVVSDICAGLEELVPDGTVRKLRIDEYGEGDPDVKPTWLDPTWMNGNSRQKAVVTCQMTITSVGGDELYNSKEYRPFPDTKQGRDELKEYMDMVNFLDQEAGKKPRLVGDFYQKVKKRPVRWYVGDPGMYKGFDLAVRTMKPKERSTFEVDQPMLNPSVQDYYKKLGFHSGVAGLPQLIYHIEEERLGILEDEVPEKELDLDTKTQRGVRVELTLLGSIIFNDLSPDCDGSKLISVLHPGMPDAPVVKQGDYVRGAFFINRPFDGSLLVQNGYCEWRLGYDEGMYEKQGESKEPLRPDGGAFVPKMVCQSIMESIQCGIELHMGCLIEVRLRYGPELHEIAPQYAKQFEQARRDAHKKGRKGGASVSMLVQIFPPEYPRPGEEGEGGNHQYSTAEESEMKDMDIE